MSFLNKLGIGIGSTARRDVSRPVGANARPRTSGTPPVGGSAPRAPESRETTRVSNGLKELLWNLDGLGKGKLLDLGPAWQTTLSFFIERGFRVSSEDVLRGWKAFLTEEEARLREDASAIESFVGFAGLPGADTGETNGGERDRIAEARRSGFCHVSQQEAGRISALPRGRFEHATNDFHASYLPGAEGLSKP